MDSKDLYFVANGKGGHVFSATMDAHARNVAALAQYGARGAARSADQRAT